jgi:hypothetical protein
VRNADGKPSTRIYLRVGGRFFSSAKKIQVLCQTIGGEFSAFLPKIKNVDRILQTVEDALIFYAITWMILDI